MIEDKSKSGIHASICMQFRNSSLFNKEIENSAENKGLFLVNLGEVFRK